MLTTINCYKLPLGNSASWYPSVYAYVVSHWLEAAIMPRPRTPLKWFRWGGGAVRSSEK